MNNGAAHPELQKDRKHITGNTSGQFKRLHFEVICSLGNDGVFIRRSATCFIALFVIAALLHNAKVINDYRLSDFEGSNLEERIPSFGPEGWSDVKLLIYMTTHLPPAHVAFLPCWRDAIERLDIFKYADLLLYTAAKPTNEQLMHLPFRKTTIKIYANPGYQAGAVQAVVDPYLDNVTWFDEYDWVMRVNPDVLIREDTWLMETMLNTSVDIIVHDCTSTNKYTDHPHFHTDFFAFRPKAMDRDILLQAGRGHAESHFTDVVRHLYDAGRYVYVEGAKNKYEGECRIAGVDSPILHVHELSNFCPYYFNVTNGAFYR